ncbi:MAG: fatty acid desaturase [Proteobacteria bacterium]|nr:fatty acid desaturase [Pseudomonadota bacterium]
MAVTADFRSREAPVPGRAPGLPAVEAGTLALILATYAAWLAATAEYGHWPLAVVAPLVALLLVLHSSLQHEILHGHPTRWRGVNALLGIVPLSLWLPYRRYHDLHLIHHINDRLTDPVDDPESNYWMPEPWARLGPVGRALVRAQLTFPGRVLIGPFWRLPRFLRAEWSALRRDVRNTRRIWLEHLLWCVPVVLWVTVVCGMPFWVYLLAMVVPGNAILGIRSFAEHRARPAMRERTAIVERSWFLGPLFLWNSLHALHHEEPLMPWYRYQRRYRELRESLIAKNGGLVYRSYVEIATRFLWRAHDAPVHPTGGVPRDRAG